MEVALYARVSTGHQQQENTIESQVRTLKAHIQRNGWNLLPEHEFRDDGYSGDRLDRPALDRLRDTARRGEIDAVVVLSPDRLARNYAHQWLLVEEFEKLGTRPIFLQNPFGDTPQGKLLTQMQGMMAEYERAQIVERTRRGRLEKARRGEFIPWAYTCYGYRYLPKQPGCPPQGVVEPGEAEVVRRIFRYLVEDQLSCRQITKRLNEAGIPTPSGRNRVWQPNTVRLILSNRTYRGQARYNYRQPVIPRYRKTDPSHLRDLKTGRCYRPESEWIWSEAPALVSDDEFEKAQIQLRRNAEAARRGYRPASRRYLLRTKVKCGECGLGMTAVRQQSTCKKYEYLYYECSGHQPLTRGRTETCPSRRVRADYLDRLVWEELCQLLRNPETLPALHQLWVQVQATGLDGLVAEQTQLRQRQQRLQRQQQRLLDAYQAEAIELSELTARRQKLTAELNQIERDLAQAARHHQHVIHWQQVMTHIETFRHLLGERLDELSFEDRQAVVRCLIDKVVVTGTQVDTYYLLPFELAPRLCPDSKTVAEAAVGDFYRLRLADFHQPAPTVPANPRDGVVQSCDRFVGYQQPFDGLLAGGRRFLSGQNHRDLARLFGVAGQRDARRSHRLNHRAGATPWRRRQGELH
jgi:site-specific DNA recombinase